MALFKQLLTFTVLGLTLIHLAAGLPDLIRIGGLFEEFEKQSSEAVFRYAVLRINQDRELMTQTKITYDIQHFYKDNSFQASQKACAQAGLGVAAIFGPRDHDVAGHINSLCNALEIPHIEVQMQPHTDGKQLFSINLFPDTSTFSKAILDLIKLFHWEKFVVFYHDEADLLMLQDVISATYNDQVEISVRQAGEDDIRENLKDIDKRGITRILAHLSTQKTYELLNAALEIGMIDAAHHYILTNLDIETIDIKKFSHNYVNLTAFRIVDRSSPLVKDIILQMKNYERRTGTKLLNNDDSITTEAALMYDAVNVFTKALIDADNSVYVRLVNLSCEAPNVAWSVGSSIYNYLNLVEMDGLSGKIKFSQGRRTEFKLDILQLQPDGLKKIGWWNTDKGINLTESIQPSSKGGMFANKTLIVTSILEPPYVMMKKADYQLTGNDQFEGFCIDLLQEIAEIVNFKYKIVLVPDGSYGAPDEKGRWNGMVKQIIDRKADLAVASLTISYIREQVIDFTKPFMNLGISILFKRPKRESPGLFSFLNPLAIEIWAYVIIAYFVVSILMFILARFSPYEWYNPHPCNLQSDEVENMFSLSNSFWFAVGTLMQQGSDINPRAVSTRIVGGLWWFFTLIIISSYTANLAAFLTVERMVSPIESAEDLAKQTRIKYGTVKGGSTMTFFKDSKIPTYQRMWAFMESKPEVFVDSSKDGIKKVQDGDYAYLMESTMIDYTVQRKCDLMQVGGLLDSKGYGVGTPMGSPFRDLISMAILNLQENGRTQMLYNKWWKNTGTCNNDEKKAESKASELGIENVGGIFVVLIVGLGLAILSAIVEFAWNSKENAKLDKCDNCRYNGGIKQSIWSEMWEELRFAIRCHGSSKKPAFRRGCSKCIHHPNDSCAVDSPNGIIQLRDMNKSPTGHLQHQQHHGSLHFRYQEAQYDPYPPEFRGVRDTQT